MKFLLCQYFQDETLTESMNLQVVNFVVLVEEKDFDLTVCKEFLVKVQKMKFLRLESLF